MFWQVFPVLDAWEMPASLASVSKEGHISTEGEDMLKRLWDLFSQLSSVSGLDDQQQLGPTHPALALRSVTFEAESRQGKSDSEIKQVWRHAENTNRHVNGSISGEHFTRDNTGGRRDLRQPRLYMPEEKDVIKILPDEAWENLRTMLFGAMDMEVVEDFLTQVKCWLALPRIAACALSDWLTQVKLPRIAACSDQFLWVAQVDRFSAEFRVTAALAVQKILSEKPDTHLKRKRKGQFDAARDLTGKGRPFLVKESIFQLVPGVSSSACVGVKHAMWRHGYWHIARSQVCLQF